jgi:radical SAM superfamily enzyme YgiQ (UPF0313 family)
VHVALVNIPYRGGSLCSLPLGMVSIAGALLRCGHEPRILDGEQRKLGVEELVDALGPHVPPLVAVTCTSYTRSEALRFVGLARDAGARHIVVGGHHFSHLAAETLARCPAVDFVISGPAEHALSRLATCLESGTLAELGAIPGLSYRQDGGIRSVPVRPDPTFVQIGRHPYELFDVNGYSGWDDLLFLSEEGQRRGIGGARTSTYSIARGCPWRCHFCANVGYWKPVLRRRREEVLEELAWMRGRGIDHVIFIDPVFSLDDGATRAFCEDLVRLRLGLRWFCSTRVNLVPDATLHAMAEAGLDVVQFGVETGSPRILSSINKGIDLALVRDRIAAAVAAGIRVKAYFMFGHPGEREEDVVSTIGFARELQETHGERVVVVSMFTDIYPGTELERVALAEGALPRDHSWFDAMDLPVNRKIQMESTRVPMYESVPIERVLELVHRLHPRLLNRDLREGYAAGCARDGAPSDIDLTGGGTCA